MRHKIKTEKLYILKDSEEERENGKRERESVAGERNRER